MSSNLVVDLDLAGPVLVHYVVQLFSLVFKGLSQMKHDETG